jgi:uncharacterized protein YxjI
MKLYMRQKVFSWNDHFTIKDESGLDKYIVEGELFSWGKKLHILDLDGRERAFIQQKVWSFLPRFIVYVNGIEVAQIVKKFTFFLPKYTVEGLNWEVEGSIFAHDYQIIKSGKTLVSIFKEWMTWGDCYEINIEPGTNELVALAVVLAIDCVLESNSGVSIKVNSN